MLTLSAVCAAKSAVWDEATSRYVVTVVRRVGDDPDTAGVRFTFNARWIIAGPGPLSVPSSPPLPGHETFKVIADSVDVPCWFHSRVNTLATLLLVPPPLSLSHTHIHTHAHTHTHTHSRSRFLPPSLPPSPNHSPLSLSRRSLALPSPPSRCLSCSLCRFGSLLLPGPCLPHRQVVSTLQQLFGTVPVNHSAVSVRVQGPLGVS